MGQPSSPASDALIYITYAFFLILGLSIAWRIRHQSKAGWLSANGSQRGQISTVPFPIFSISSSLASSLNSG